MSSDKPKYHFEENQTEGAHPTAFRFDNTEIKKGDFAVATHLRNLYDVDVITLPPIDGDVLKFESAIGKWVPGKGGGCALLSGEMFLHVRYIIEDNRNPTPLSKKYDYFADVGDGDGGLADPIDENEFPLGTFENPFSDLPKCMQWINNNCRVIADGAKINIIIASWDRTAQNADNGIEGSLPLYLSWDNFGSSYDERFFIQYEPMIISYPYSHRIFIYGIDETSLEEEPSEINNVTNWMFLPAFTKPLRIQFRGDIVCNSDCDCSEFDNAIRKLKPFITVTNGLTLGGVYNIKFYEPDVNIECAGGSSSDSGESSSPS